MIMRLPQEKQSSWKVWSTVSSSVLLERGGGHFEHFQRYVVKASDSAVIKPPSSTQFWPTPEPNITFTPLLACIHWRKLKRFIGATLALLPEPSDDADTYGELLITLLRTRILPEIEGMREEDAAEIRSRTIRLVLEVLCISDSTGREYLLMHLCNWYQTEKLWRDSIEAALDDMVRSLQYILYAIRISSVYRFVNLTGQQCCE